MNSKTRGASYELPLVSLREKPSSSLDTSLPRDLMLGNLAWYCRIRWVVAAVFVLFGLGSFLPGFYGYFELKEPLGWAFYCSVILILANSVFIAHIRYLRKSHSPVGLSLNLWTQVVLDQFVATATVHQVGSIETTISLAYFFHIVLACIFLPRWQSLVVTLLACLFFGGCIILETTNILPSAGIFENSALRYQMEETGYIVFFNTASTAISWLVIWYMASSLASLLMKTRANLQASNKHLLAAQRERMQHMLHTTHELKAPFAAIHANTQLLLKGYCGPLQPDAQEVVQRIADRCRGLTRAIQEMLQLANLRSQSDESLTTEQLDISVSLKWCLTQVQQIAEEKQVGFQTEIQPATMYGVEDHNRVLFINLLTNAVLYSHPRGRVLVRCGPGAEGHATVSIEDSGIGIPVDKLPHIFEEYYRTTEAVQHNKNSTGLGLAIVREIARRHQIRIRVESAPGAGTRVTIVFP